MRWSEMLSALARTGMAFTDSLYEQERFEEILLVAAEIAAATSQPLEPARLVEEWTKTVGHGVPGYVTPKNTVGAIVGNDDGELLLVQRSDSGFWLYPTGWADVGYSAAEVAVKEVWEETGIKSEVVRLIGVNFSHLVEGGHQINLFEDNDKVISLYQAMDRIRKRYGSRSVINASGLGAKSIGRTNPFNGEAPLLLANRRQ